MKKVQEVKGKRGKNNPQREGLKPSPTHERELVMPILQSQNPARVR
jgi:hypothetical protein